MKASAKTAKKETTENAVTTIRVAVKTHRRLVKFCQKRGLKIGHTVDKMIKEWVRK